MRFDLRTSRPMPLVLRVLFALIVSALAQTCEPYTANVPQCAGLIDYLVWVPPGATQQSLASSLTQYVSGVSLLPGDCARAAVSALCSSAFRACNASDSALPLPLCRDFCTRGFNICTGIPQASAILNCSATDPIFGDPVPLWSALSTCVIANTSTATLLCPLPFTYQPSAQSCTMKMNRRP